ncbi:recombinase family protein [Rhodospirillales bacterium]|nr:recombinase family protein [Rhodospirillales bacterium]
MISQRTKAALQASKARGTRLGWSMPSRKCEQRQATAKANQANRDQAAQFADNVLPIVREIEATGANTLQAIANALNARGIHTARGGKWYPTTVKNLKQRQAA